MHHEQKTTVTLSAPAGAHDWNATITELTPMPLAPGLGRNLKRRSAPLRHLGLARTFALLALAWAIGADLGAPNAQAGTIAVVSCKEPVTDAVEPTEGWVSTWAGTPEPGAGNVNECANRGALESYVAQEVPHNSSAGPIWKYAPPAGDAIVGGEVNAWLHVPGSHSSNYSGQAGLTAPGLQFDGANLVTRASNAGLVEGSFSLAGHTNGEIFLYAFCNSTAAQCPEGQSLEWDWSFAAVRWADIELSNNATPSGTGFAGAVAESGPPLTGQANLTFTAHDDGLGASGVYRVDATLDGHPIYTATPDTNGGACVALPARQAGILEFTSAHPCRTSESLTIPVSTTSVKDGAHELVVSVTDAAGNAAVVYAHVLSTVNAPTTVLAPTVSGSASVGSMLTARPGSFTAPEGSGSVQMSGQWLRCTDTTGSHCSSIPAATATTYSPMASDAGYYLEYATTATDNDGSTTAASPPTVPVNEPAQETPGAGGGAGGAGGAGGSAGSGSTDVTPGSGGAGGSGGSGVTVSLTSPPSGPALLGSLTPWLINLRSSRRLVHRGQTVIFSGLVESSPRPPAGKLVYLEARAVTVRRTGPRHHGRARTVYGPWLTFAAPRAEAKGRYHAYHRFKLGGRHTYQFQAIAPQESGYINVTGHSQIVTVHVRPKG